MNRNSKERQGRVVIPAGAHPWPHELRVAQILAEAGHVVEFLTPSTTKTADILLDGTRFEIKSPQTDKSRQLEKVIKRALAQSPNIIIDSSRIKNIRDDNLKSFLVRQKQARKQINRMIFITKQGKIIDINRLK